MTTKDAMLDSGELSIHSRRDYYVTCERLVESLGKNRLLTDIRPEDFEKLGTTWAVAWGPVRLGNEINRTRVVFNYAYRNGLIDRPMRYGEGFRRPSRKVLLLARAEKGTQMFEAKELSQMLEAARQPMKAMLLLGINAGLGNNDVSRLLPSSIPRRLRIWDVFTDSPRSHLSLRSPTTKGKRARRVPLWSDVDNLADLAAA
jgi:integrase